ncbi:TPA: hypothetical protein ACH3X1_003447 [Trebouxia sp. C0004]
MMLHGNSKRCAQDSKLKLLQLFIARHLLLAIANIELSETLIFTCSGVDSCGTMTASLWDHCAHAYACQVFPANATNWFPVQVCIMLRSIVSFGEHLKVSFCDSTIYLTYVLLCLTCSYNISHSLATSSVDLFQLYRSSQQQPQVATHRVYRVQLQLCSYAKSTPVTLAAHQAQKLTSWTV